MCVVLIGRCQDMILIHDCSEDNNQLGLVTQKLTLNPAFSSYFSVHIPICARFEEALLALNQDLGLNQSLHSGIGQIREGAQMNLNLHLP